ncbi:MAG TPA: AIPR family protein [Longimicrobiaceae bacterium]|jgi:hypothetical protein
MTSYDTAFASRADLEQYGSNALLMFALELRFGLEDIHTVAADALTDGSDDKKCDLIFVDLDEGVAVVAQGFQAADPSKKEAPANKASDLNTAAGWLLSRDVNDLPARIRPAAIQLRSALEDGQIQTIHFWYVHNLPESPNVSSELETVQRNAYAGLRHLLGAAAKVPDVTAVEVGRGQLDEWYKTRTTPILVTDQLSVSVPGGYEIESTDWSAYVTAVPAKWLYTLFEKYKDELFSANVRGYLGSRKADANINSGIKSTAGGDPVHFWVYNNGLTILTHKFEYNSDDKELVVTGLSIVNGAQTTGAIGSLDATPDDSAMVPARFVRCQSGEVVTRIIKYNNSQNQVEAPDFRSGDEVQRRLREEFRSVPSVTYLGGRRGGYEDRIKRPPNLLPSDTAGQALASFHGDPVVAYNEKSRIWVSDTLYSRYFSERTTARHIVFAYSLLRSVEEKKRLLAVAGKEELTEKQEKVLQFFRNRGATFLLTAAIGSALETVVGRPIPDRFALAFKGNLAPQDAVELWTPIVTVATAFTDRLVPAVERGLKSAELVSSAVSDFSSFMDATGEANRTVYDTFAKHLDLRVRR